MMKQYLLGALSLACMVAFAAPAHAQSTSNGTGTANVNTQQQTAANSTNAGVNAQVNQYGASDIHTSVNSQVPLSVVGYGSFSQNGCVSSTGLGASTKIFSFVYNAPTPEQNCQHGVRSDQFGRESQLAKSQDKPIQAEILRASGVYQTCTSSDDTIVMCIRAGLIAYVDPDHPDIHETKPVMHFEETSNTRVVPPNAPTADVRTQGQNPQASAPGQVAKESQSLADSQAAAGPNASLDATSVGGQAWYRNASR